MSSAPIPQRPLGMFEKNQVAKQLTKGYCSVTLTAVLHHPPRSDTLFYKRYLYSALLPLIQTHPMLRLSVSNVDLPSAHFVQLTSLRLDDLVTVTDQDRFWDLTVQERIVTEECQKEFDLFGMVPLWHLRVSCHPDRLDQCSITLSLQHVIADGLSTTVIWKDILHNLNHVEGSNDDMDTFVYDTSDQIHVPLPIEDRNGPKDTSISPSDPMPHNGWEGDYPAPENETLDTVLRLVNVDNDTMARLVGMAKAKGVSMHAVIFTAYFLSWLEHYPDQAVKSISAINCRPYCQPPVPADELGVFFGRYECGWPLEKLSTYSAASSTTTFWRFCQHYHTLIQNNKLLTCQRSLLMGDSLPNYPQDYCDVWYNARKTFKMGRSGGINMSDLGRFNYLPGNKWTLHHLWFAQSAHSYAAVVAINIISANGIMHAAVTWQRGSIDDTKAVTIMEDFAARLQKESLLDS